MYDLKFLQTTTAAPASWECDFKKDHEKSEKIDMHRKDEGVGVLLDIGCDLLGYTQKIML